MRRILHVDMDAFYASVEQRDEPAFQGKPVIVGADPRDGHGRGVVAACSYEARKFGIHSALPIGMAWRRCPHGVYLRPRMEVYRGVSAEIMATFRDYTELVEPISLDEAFLDVSGSVRLLGPASSIARRIKNDIRQRTGLTASVGVAPNKFLAKLASELEKPDGFVEVSSHRVAEFLAPLPTRSVPGVGPRTGEKLERMGLKTIGQLARISRGELVGRLGAAGDHLWSLSQGLDERPVVPQREPKSISNETTFEHDVDDVRVLKITLQQLSDKVAHRLRQSQYRASRITMKLRLASFSTHTRQRSVREGINTGSELYREVERLFDAFDRSEHVRLLGVGAGRLTRDHLHPQLKLFSHGDRHGNLARVVDEVQEKYGRDSIRRGSELE